MMDGVAIRPERQTAPVIDGCAESHRLAALDLYGVLDTSPEPAFDRIVKLAALIIGVPITLISLIDTNRQWFKAKSGLEAPETPRAMAFCDHAIRGRGVMVVPDAREDDRFADNPLVTGAPDIRFYAGAPLVTPGGFVLGTLCAIDRTPRHLSEHEAEILTALAEQVVHELEVRAALGEMYQAVAEGRRLARTLQGEGAKLAALLDATGTAVITADGCGRVASLNRVAESLFGLSTNEALGWPIHSLITTESDFSGEEADNISEGIGLRRGGVEFPVEIAHAHWVDANGQRASGAIIRDVTRRHEARLRSRKQDAAERRQETLAMLGQMAGGIAHEINNLLQPVIGLTTIELDNLSADGSAKELETRENLETIADCGRQMRGIVRKILMFARKESSSLIDLDFPNALRRAIAFVGHLLPRSVRIETDFGDEQESRLARPYASIDEVQLIEVMSNLALNAVHAMDGKGVLSIRLSQVSLDDRVTASLGIDPGPYFQVAVRDEGVGMDPVTLAQIFNPFFTTKEIGSGTGLGLSLVHGVVRDWKGAIEVDSALGRGTVFTLYIPISQYS